MRNVEPRVHGRSTTVVGQREGIPNFNSWIAKIDAAATLALVAMLFGHEIIVRGFGWSEDLVSLGFVAMLLSPRVVSAWWRRRHPWLSAWSLILTSSVLILLVPELFLGSGAFRYLNLWLPIYLITSGYTFIWMLVAGLRGFLSERDLGD